MCISHLRTYVNTRTICNAFHKGPRRPEQPAARVQPMSHNVHNRCTYKPSTHNEIRFCEKAPQLLVNSATCAKDGNQRSYRRRLISAADMVAKSEALTSLPFQASSASFWFFGPFSFLIKLVFRCSQFVGSYFFFFFVFCLALLPLALEAADFALALAFAFPLGFALFIC